MFSSLTSSPRLLATATYLFMAITSIQQISNASAFGWNSKTTTTTTTTATTGRTTRPAPWNSPCTTRQLSSPTLAASSNDQNDSSSSSSTKFGFGQRVESIKSAVVGAVAGGVALTPVGALHDLVFASYPNGLAQWEFDTDMGSLQAALFAIVYRYAVREGDDNDMLNMGVVGAFVFCRTLSRVQVPFYCSAVPLTCGPPFEYLDWNMLAQVAWSGAESAALFGVAAAAIDYCFDKRFISKFPQ